MGGFHVGEAAAQDRFGMRDRMAEVATRAIRDHLPEQHRDFFALLPFLVAGHVDADGQPRASLLAGPPGFATSPDPRHLAVRARARPGDPFAPVPGQSLGLLGLQPHTRRRNRLNGHVVAADADGFTVQVAQSFGNCPKYIVPREAVHAPATGVARTVAGDRLDARAEALLDRADLVFVATAHPQAGRSPDAAHGVDVSHRGGPPGFVARRADGTLAWADQPGNLFFNTFGNLALEPRAALLVPDPATGDLLHLTVRAEVVWSADRHVRCQVLGMTRLEHAMPLAWRPPAGPSGMAG